MLPGIFLIIVQRHRTARVFDRATAAFAFHASLLGSGCRPGWAAGFGRLGCPAKQSNQPVKRILPILLLGTEAPGLDHQHPASGQPLAGQPE